MHNMNGPEPPHLMAGTMIPVIRKISCENAKDPCVPSFGEMAQTNPWGHLKNKKQQAFRKHIAYKIANSDAQVAKGICCFIEMFVFFIRMKDFNAE